MKPKHLFLAIAVLLAAGGLWLAGTAWRSRASHKSSTDVGFKTPDGSNLDPNRTASLSKSSQAGRAADPKNLPKPGQTLNSPARLAPPDPSRRFTEFTPEQRVQFARQGHGPGG